MELSRRIGSLQDSATFVVSDKARALKAKGIDVVSFSAGEPDFDTPDVIKEAGIKAIKEGFTKYTTSSGIIELRKVIADKLKKDNQLDYDPSEIVVSCGAKHSIFNVIQSVCNEGDEVLIPSPCWVSYTEMVKAAAAKPVIVRALENEGFHLNYDILKKHINSKTKLIILNSPNNPTGVVYTQKDLEIVARLALEKEFFILSDEIYEKMIYGDAKHISIVSLDKRLKDISIVVNGVSKAYSMTGWRIGYAAGPKPVMDAISRLQTHTTSNPVSISQKAAIAAITLAADDCRKMVQEFQKRRDYMIAKLCAIENVKCVKPEGAFYAFPDVSGLFNKKFNGKPIGNSNKLAELLIDEAHIALVPGSAFLADNFIRFAYATSMENIIKGMERFERFCAETK
ncbi:MAG: pyridoxal phosphate-dependent aminotransferase [Planctomycetes bacterium]|nr:pyridoxal phosphate-dependent aminotransferase [Planctomycetota bacterium]